MEANEPKEGDDDVTNEESTHQSNFASPSQWVTALAESDHILGPQRSPTQDASPLSRTVDRMYLFWPYRTQKSWFNLPTGNLSPNIELSEERVVKANLGQGDRPTHRRSCLWSPGNCTSSSKSSLRGGERPYFHFLLKGRRGLGFPSKGDTNSSKPGDGGVQR